MELYSPLFFQAVLNVLESNIPILASIPIPKFGRDIPGGNILKTQIRITALQKTIHVFKFIASYTCLLNALPSEIHLDFTMKTYIDVLQLLGCQFSINKCMIDYLLKILITKSSVCLIDI